MEFRSFVDVGQPVSMGPDETPYYTWTQLLDDRAYFAYQREDKRIEVIAAEAKTGKELWRKQSQDTSEEWGGITAVPGGVVVFAKSSLSDEPYDVSVWSADDGRRLWGMPIFGDDGVFFREDRLILVDRAQNRVAGFDLLSGSLKWQEKTPKDRFESTQTAVYGVSTPDDLAGPADALGRPFAPKADDDQRIVQVSADKSMRVIDAASGKIGGTRTNVADKDDPAYAYDGRFVVATDAGVFSYDLDSDAQPARIYSPADDQHDVTGIAPCGEDRVCLLETTSFDATTTELVAVDAEKGGAVWHKPAAGMERVVPVGDYVLVSGDSPDYVVSLFDAAGKVVHTQPGVGMRVNGGSVLLLSKYLTSSVGDPERGRAGRGREGADPVGPADRGTDRELFVQHRADRLRRRQGIPDQALRERLTRTPRRAPRRATRRARSRPGSARRRGAAAPRGTAASASTPVRAASADGRGGESGGVTDRRAASPPASRRRRRPGRRTRRRRRRAPR